MSRSLEGKSTLLFLLVALVCLGVFYLLVLLFAPGSSILFLLGLAAGVVALPAVLFIWFWSRNIASSLHEVALALRRITQGKPHIKLYGISADQIGELKQAFNEMAAQVEETVNTLSSEKAKLSAIIANMADAVVATDPEGAIVLANPAARKLFNLEGKAFQGSPFAEAVRDYEVNQILRDCLRERQPRTGQVDLGTGRGFLRVTAVPLEPGPRAALLVAQDLSELRRLDRTRRDFVANISHELLTPLASIKAVVETLRDGALEDKAAAANFLSRIETEVDYLAKLVKELLELSFLETGRAELKLAPLDVPQAVEEVVARLRPQIERKGLALQVAFPPDLPPVMADAERLRQVLTNLIHNAIKFTPTGGTITISARFQENQVAVSVADTGIGIPARELPHVLERFYKGDRSRSGEGAGLGLSIVKHIVLAHKGEIRVQSREGEGTTFTFTLPVAGGPEPDQVK